MAFLPQVQFQSKFSGGEFICPQYLFNLGNADVLSDALGLQTDVPFPKPHRGVKHQDVGTLQPGKQYQLSPDPMPTPQSILDGSYLHHHRDIVVVIPRLPKHCGAPSLPSVNFSVDGKFGPFVGDLVHNRVTVDDALDFVFEDRIWKQTSLTIDWPGVSMPAEYISCLDKENRHLTRMKVANMVALRVHNVVMTGKDGLSFKWGPQMITEDTKAWDLRKIDYRGVRLLAINYYRRTWIPVLAISRSE